MNPSETIRVFLLNMIYKDIEMFVDVLLENEIKSYNSECFRLERSSNIFIDSSYANNALNFGINIADCDLLIILDILQPNSIGSESRYGGSFLYAIKFIVLKLCSARDIIMTYKNNVCS